MKSKWGYLRNIFFKTPTTNVETEFLEENTRKNEKLDQEWHVIEGNQNKQT